MTAYRSSTPDVDAVQFTPAPDEPLTFSDRPAWLEQEITHRRIYSGTTPEGIVYLVVPTKLGPQRIAAGSWILRDLRDLRRVNLDVATAAAFATDYDLFEAPAGPPKTAAGAPTGSQETTTTTGATK